MARLRSFDHPIPPERLWVRYQLVSKGIRLEAVAKKANRSISMVSQFISGFKNSEAVGLALARILGYATYQDLMDTACQQAKRGVA